MAALLDILLICGALSLPVVFVWLLLCLTDPVRRAHSRLARRAKSPEP